MNLPAALALVALSLALASAAVMFLISRAPGWYRVRLMGFVALSAASYCAVNLVSFLVPNDAAALQWIFEVNLVTASVHGCMWLWYTFAGPDSSWRSVPRWAKRQGLGTVAFNLTLALTRSATDRLSAHPSPPGLRGVATIAYDLSLAGNLGALLVLLMLVSCGYEYWRRARAGTAGATAILVGFLLFAACIVEEALVAAGLLEFYFLSDVGYLVIVLPLASQLLARFSDDARRLADLSTELATEVEQRTSERDAARESLLEQQRLAALGRLAAGVGHEINNPLQYLMSNLEELHDGLSNAERSRGDAEREASLGRAVSQAMEGGERIRQVVESLRRYGAARDTFTPVDIDAVVRAALRIAGPQLRSLAAIKMDLATVPNVLGNEGKLVQTLVNVLVNAGQALTERPHPDREPCLTVRTRREPNDRVSITVEDNGPGFPAQVLARIGEPFVTTRVATGGTGLGLFVTHGLVASHQGTLQLENAAAGGAIVRVLLPAAETHADHPPAPRSGPVVQLPASSATHRRILVVDDEPALLTVLARSLTRLGHQVVTASNGAEALLKLEEQGGATFDVVLSDLTMPVMSGVTFAAALEERYPALRGRLLIMTGGAMSSEDEAFLQRADVVVVEKPVRLADLSALLDALPTSDELPVAHGR
jgi:signal transduction histidine kinase/CheY-like chemotaxis protein